MPDLSNDPIVSTNLAPTEPPPASVLAGQLGRRGFMGLIAASGAAIAGKAIAETPTTAPSLPGNSAPLTGLSFDAEQQHQMLGALDAIIDRARMLATQYLPNGLPPAELFDPRLPGWEKPARRDKALRPATLPPLPTSAEDIAFAPAWQLSGWIKARKLTSRALTDIYLDRIAARAPRLHCMVTVLADSARAEAEAADRMLAAGKWLGPLHGLPYGLKDLVDTAGVITGWGAEPYRNRVPSSDATIVARLRAAGAVLIAKTSCGALAFGDIWYGGKTRNPWNVEEGSSGSSAGSASAVADGLCAFAIGTETMGSIISPSNRCGAVGLRPTFGRVPRTGAMALCWSYDKIGPITRDPLDSLPILTAMAGPDGLDPCASDEPLPPIAAVNPGEITLGYRPEWFANGGPTDRAALDAARSLGFQLIEVTMPDIDLNLLSGLVTTESASAFEELTATGLDKQLTWQDDVAWPNSWRAAHYETAVAYIQAQRIRRQLMQSFAKTMAGVDALLHPNGAAGMIGIGNHCGYPAIIFPAGFVDQPTRKSYFGAPEPTTGLPKSALHSVPFGISLTGHLFDEARLVGIAHLIAGRIGLGIRRPPA